MLVSPRTLIRLSRPPLADFAAGGRVPSLTQNPHVGASEWLLREADLCGLILSMKLYFVSA